MLRPIERALSHDRWIVIGGLVAVTALSGAWTLSGGATGMSAWDMTAITGPPGALIAGTPDMAMGHWTFGYALVIFIMWWLMMVAMMVPSAAPVILLHAALRRDRNPAGTLWFLLGYLGIWAAFSLGATALQAGLVALGWMSGMYMNLVSPWLGSAVLIAAGSYQFTPLKRACLRACRGPVEALTRLRRTGAWSDFRIGAANGRECLGCCWALMALLFVGGVMNLWWVLGVAGLVAAEKLGPAGERLSQVTGIALILGGGLLGLHAAALI